LKGSLVEIRRDQIRAVAASVEPNEEAEAVEVPTEALKEVEPRWSGSPRDPKAVPLRRPMTAKRSRLLRLDRKRLLSVSQLRLRSKSKKMSRRKLSAWLKRFLSRRMTSRKLPSARKRSLNLKPKNQLLQSQILSQ